jgi:lysylphosphatidylglycerol synthetase-like protein (DUF2156 family)
MHICDHQPHKNSMAWKEHSQNTALLMDPDLSGRDATVRCVRLWGGASSDAVLDPACHHFRTHGIEGVIGYRTTGKCAVVYGDPICSPDRLDQLTAAFHTFCEEKNWKVVYIFASQEQADLVCKQTNGAALQVMEELYLNPTKDAPTAGAKGSLARRKMRHAVREGVEVLEYSGDDVAIEKAIENVGEEWLNSRKGVQIFISHIRLFEDRYGKRWFYARREGKIIGVIVLNQLQNKDGWLLNRLMAIPDAPNGTSEQLVLTAFETLKKEGCSFLSFGAMSQGEITSIHGLGPFVRWFARWIYFRVSKIFRLDSLKKFWGKFQPHSKPTYVVLTRNRVGLRELIGLKKALNIGKGHHD